MPPLTAVKIILRNLSKGVKTEPIPMSKVAWDMKYNLAPPGSNTMEKLPFRVDTPRGQRQAVDFIKSVTQDSNERGLLDEITSLMDHGVFSYEDALAKGIVKSPKSPERKMLDYMFKDFDPQEQ
jgi:hypothetical protein